MTNNIKEIIINNKKIPFNYGQIVYVIEDIPVEHKTWVPPDYSLGGDADGPFDRGHYHYTYTYKKEVRKTTFCFGLLDRYNIDEIYSDKNDAQFAILLKEREELDKK